MYFRISSMVAFFNIFLYYINILTSFFSLCPFSTSLSLFIFPFFLPFLFFLSLSLSLSLSLTLSFLLLVNFSTLSLSYCLPFSLPFSFSLSLSSSLFLSLYLSCLFSALFIQLLFFLSEAIYYASERASLSTENVFSVQHTSTTCILLKSTDLNKDDHSKQQTQPCHEKMSHDVIQKGKRVTMTILICFLKHTKKIYFKCSIVLNTLLSYVLLF